MFRLAGHESDLDERNGARAVQVKSQWKKAGSHLAGYVLSIIRSMYLASDPYRDLPYTPVATNGTRTMTLLSNCGEQVFGFGTNIFL